MQPSVEGNDFFSGGLLATVTPTLSWQPSPLGQPSRYKVFTYWLSASGTKIVETLSGAIVTPDTWVKIPTGLLEKNQTYVFRITATVATGASPPLRGYPPGASADALSGMFTVD